MNVIIVRSNPVSPDPRVEKEATALAKNGHSVNVLAWDRSCNYPVSEKSRNYTISRIRIRATYGTPCIIPKVILWNFREFAYLLTAEFNVVHACDFDTLIPAFFVSKIKNTKLVFDSFDFYADCLPGVPNWIRKIIAQVEILFAKLSDLVILADDSRENQYKNKLKNTVIINNTPSDEKLTQIRYKIENYLTRTASSKFKIFYAGILDKNRGFEQMIDAIKCMPDVELTIAGFGADEKELVELFKSSKNVKFIGKIGYEDVLKLTIVSDLLFALYNPRIPNHRYASPNKLFEAMMCGKPIIVSEGTIMADVVRNEDCGIVVRYGDKGALADAISRLKDSPSEAKRLGKNGRKAYDKKYSWKIMEERLIHSYQKLKRGLNEE